jgi:RimJ/RimL family protein N-acetyltransferase
MRQSLRGQRVLLRPLCEDDLSRRAGWTADRELQLLMGSRVNDDGTLDRSHEEELDANRAWLAGRVKSGTTPYAVEVDGVYVGDIDYGIYPEQGKAELTVFLGDRSAWGKGYGTEAVNLIMDEIFRDDRIEFIEVDVVPGNERALAFWKKLGFAEHGVDEQGIQRLRCGRNR